MDLVPVVLLLVLGTVGVVDLGYYHLWKFQLYRQRFSRGEQVTHLVRGALFAVCLGLLLGWRPAGAWYWAVCGALALDFANSILDVALEPASRKPLGGVPPVEYLVHVVTSTVSGAVAASFAICGWSGRLDPTALVPRVDVPALILWDGRLVLLGAIGFSLLETVLFARSFERQRSLAT